jgi:hypothetical protein
LLTQGSRICLSFYESVCCAGGCGILLSSSSCFIEDDEMRGSCVSPAGEVRARKRIGTSGLRTVCLRYLYLLIATCRLWGRDQSKEADEATVRSWDDGEAEEGWWLKESSTEEECGGWWLKESSTEEECGAGSEREMQEKTTLRYSTLYS